MKLIEELKLYKDAERAKSSERFFKTGPGEYGEGDKFWGVKVPDLRRVAKKFYRDCPVAVAFELLKNEVHEVRLTALFVLVYKFEKAALAEREKIAKLYLENARRVNNWDLVDSSAPHILGQYLLERVDERKVLYDLVVSEDLWERRIAVLATFRLINHGDFADFLRLAETLLEDEHDLIHKAVGWGLREVGKRDMAVLESFLEKNIEGMPRTMLRYAIEKMEEVKRKAYLKR